jgi:hypothetical protein
MECHADPELIECRDKCKKALDCGHFCQRRCKEDCYPCPQLVAKVIPNCGHTAKVPCARDPVKEDCPKKCERKLTCGHDCKALCFQQCTENCREVVEVEKGWCGHEVERFCFEKEKGEFLPII